MVKLTRKKTGIEGLDMLLPKGVPSNHLILVSGQAGAGKSIMSMQFLVAGVQELGEKGLFISFEQTRDDIVAQAENFKWNMNKLEKEGKIKIMTFNPNKDHVLDMLKHIDEVIKTFKPDRIVVDSITTYSIYAETLTFFDTLMNYGLKKENLHLAPSPRSVSRKAITDILTKIKSYNLLAFIISELPENSEYLSRDTISEFFCDGVILLKHVPIGDSLNRSIEVRKMRQVRMREGSRSYNITKKGIVIEI